MAQHKTNSKIIDIRERTFSFACRIVKLALHLAEQRGPAYVLSKQIIRAGTSVGANLEEATAGCSKADFIAKCNISLKEARETLFWLKLLETTELVQAGKLSSLKQEADELVAILTTIVKKSRARMDAR
jgi:four helix bundle protein